MRQVAAHVAGQTDVQAVDISVCSFNNFARLEAFMSLSDGNRGRKSQQKNYNVGGNAKQREFNWLWRENYKHPQMESIRCKRPITSSDQVNTVVKICAKCACMTSHHQIIHFKCFCFFHMCLYHGMLDIWPQKVWGWESAGSFVLACACMWQCFHVSLQWCFRNCLCLSLSPFSSCTFRSFISPCLEKYWRGSSLDFPDQIRITRLLLDKTETSHRS